MKNQNAWLPKRILCPMDFSELSDLALKYAAIGAREFKAELSILHADPFDAPRYFSRSEDKTLLRQLEKAKQSVQKTVSDHARKILGGLMDQLPVGFKVFDRHPIDAILDAAENERTDLIVLGTHGYRGFKRFLLGSVTENIVRNTKVPVFTVRQKTHDFIDSHAVDSVPSIKRILCPCDLSATAVPALGIAISMAGRFQAELTVLYSIDREPAQTDIQKLNAWIADVTDHDDRLKPVVQKGHAPEQIISYAKAKQIDLIILGANHRPFMADTVMGKTTELVLRQAPVPVLAVPHVI